jgi:hypothetical protein
MGLKVAPQKTEVLFFHDGSQGEPPRAHIMLGDIRVEVEPKMTYLGLVLDGTWGFRPHFEADPKVGRVANKLSRLLPNIGGPGVKAACLYTNTILSVALYGAPVWADVMSGDRCIQRMMHRSMRMMAIRVVRSYRIVSFLEAGALAGVPP